MLKNIFCGGALIESSSANIGITVLRVFAGLSMALAHGLGKVPPSEGLVQATAGMGFPLPGLFAWAAALSEFGGGLLLALGLATRPAAVFVGFTMAVAAFIRHADDPFGSQEKALLYLAICVALALIGAGKYSVDNWLNKRSAAAY